MTALRASLRSAVLVRPQTSHCQLRDTSPYSRPFFMNWIGIITTLLTVVNILICLLLIFVVLLQRPKNEGLGAAFGGDTASNIFGAQTTNVLANLTRWLGGLFLGICLIIAVLGTIDPTRKSAITDFVNQRAAEKKAAEEQKKAQEAAQKAEKLLPKADRK